MKRERLESELVGVKYPHVHVRLVGEDGNAFSILGCVNRELRSAGISREEIMEFGREATSGDYDHLLQTVMVTVTCDSGSEEAEDE